MRKGKSAEIIDEEMETEAAGCFTDIGFWDQLAIPRPMRYN